MTWNPDPLPVIGVGYVPPVRVNRTPVMCVSCWRVLTVSVSWMGGGCHRQCKCEQCDYDGGGDGGGDLSHIVSHTYNT